MLTLKDKSLLRSQNFINGEWASGGAGTIDVTNPANGEIVITTANGDAADAERAVLAAAEAFKSWSRVPAKERAVLLRAWFNLLMENADDLGAIMTAEQGKPLFESVGEVAYGASFIEYYAEESKRYKGDTIPTISNDRRLQTYKQPVGVVGCITPWNFPNAMIGRKAGPALAAGCTIVIKPATETPLSALAMCDLADRAGIPKGVINVVAGSNSREIGKVLTEHPLIRAIAFVGESATGSLIQAQGAPTLKRVHFELGGKNPVIVFDDADLEQALDAVVFMIYSLNGERCTSSSRLLVQRSIEDEFVARLTERVHALRVGHPLDPDTEIGPLIHPRHRGKVRSYLAAAEEDGAGVVVGGGAGSDPESCYVDPMLFTGASSSMRVAKEEIFGPVLTVIGFDDEADAVALANDTEYGLAGYLWTGDTGRAHRVARDLEAGMVWVNSHNVRHLPTPFGGSKRSGIGRDGGPEHSFEFYTETKNVAVAYDTHPSPGLGRRG